MAASLGLSVLVWRNPPRDNKCLGTPRVWIILTRVSTATCPGAVARGSEPVISQVFVVPRDESLDTAEVNKKMFLLRKLATHNIPAPGVRLDLLRNFREIFHVTTWKLIESKIGMLELIIDVFKLNVRF